MVPRFSQACQVSRSQEVSFQIFYTEGLCGMTVVAKTHFIISFSQTETETMIYIFNGSDIFYLTHYVLTVFKKYTKYRIMLKIVKYDLKKCIKNTIMIKYNEILRNKLFTKPRSLKLM